MRTSLKLAVAIATTAVTIAGGSAFASSRPGGGSPQSADCVPGSTTVAVNGPNVVWPPNHKSHDYTVTYSGTTISGDTLTTTASSSDSNAGVSTTDPQSASVVNDGDSASTTTGLRAERAGSNKAGRTYMIHYSVDNAGTNLCSGDFTFVAPHDRRKAK